MTPPIDLSLPWQVIEGDCLDVMRELPDGCVDAVVTDVPYGVVTRELGEFRNNYGTYDKGAADALSFDVADFARECSRLARGSIYVFCGWEQVSLLMVTFEALGLTKRMCVWEKTSASPMNGEKMWLSGVEMCVFARKANATFNEFCKVPVWRYPSGTAKRHPTEKPLDLMKRIVAASTDEGDIVLDPCLGSGTTGHAAVSLCRRFIGIEREPAYVAIARQRIADAAAQGNLFDAT